MGSRAVLTALGVVLLVVVGASGHVPGSTPPPDTSDCHATVIATDGTPPPGTPQLDPQKLCEALKRAEQEAGSR